MPLLLAVLLTAGASLPTPAEQQHSAAAVYQVYTAVIATGTFNRVLPSSGTFSHNVHDRLAIVGSAFAVDSHGWLLTARHVVDPAAIVGEFCREIEKTYTRFRVDRVQLDLTLTDIVGHVWPAQSVVTPPNGSRDDVCHSSGPLQVQREPFWPVTIVKLDDVADVALLKITQRDGPIATVSFGIMAALRLWQPVYALGMSDQLMMRNGLFVRPCEIRFAPADLANDFGPDVTVGSLILVSRYVLDGEPGMSGGPILAGNTVVGITVAVGATHADPSHGISAMILTLAVPVDYAHAWYLWARGLDRRKPLRVCTPPEIEVLKKVAPSR